MALEGGDDRGRRRVEEAAWRDPVAVLRQQGLRGLDLRAAIARTEGAAVADRRGLYPMADARAVEIRPWEALAWILLAAGRDVRMCENPLPRDRPAADDVPAERRHRGDLRGRKRGKPAVVSGIGDFDADRAGIDVAVLAPR